MPELSGGGGAAPTYPIAVNKGGTGAEDAATARTNLGLGAAATKAVGTEADQVAAGNHDHAGIYEPADGNLQAHLIDTGNPHQTSDANLVVTDVTTNNVGTTQHGFVPKAPDDATQVFLGNGNWGAVPSPAFPLTKALDTIAPTNKALTTSQSPAGFGKAAINMSGLTAFSIDFWYKPSAGVGVLSFGSSPLSDSPEFVVQRNSSTTIQIWCAGGWNLTSSTTISNGTYYHIAVTWDGTTWKLYVNGNLDDTHASATFGMGANSIFWVGAGYNDYASMDIDELRLWTVDISANIATYYNSGNGYYGDSSLSLKAAFHFDETSGMVAYDYSGNGNHLYLGGEIAWASGTKAAGSTTADVSQNIVNASDAANAGEKGITALGAADHRNDIYGLVRFMSGVGGFETVRIDRAGKVGVNTTTPNAHLDVQGGMALKVRSIGSSSHVFGNDIVLICQHDGAGITITLPKASMSAGRFLIIKDDNHAGTYNVTIDGNASETIDGATTLVLSSNYAVARLFCDGSKWYSV